MKSIWKYISILFAGVIAGMFLSPKKEETNNVQGDLIESQKVKDNSKDKRKRKGLFSFLKRDPEKKAERIKRKELRKQKKNS